ncbi:cell division protein Fic [Amylibacter ulvae]|uniref:Cell division protein Fic n=1 Tax=Paramylibacter ulvae TaxID=1651968 RepID=A0ABQ3D925_9RHOB|nr:Fic family protein [Amylibacter ulvae]GHA61826.1 cell division protein Fic [Amylibacter ulvae]
MTEIWESPYWPNFGVDNNVVEPYLARLSHGLGRVHGVHAGLSPADREQILLREIAQEAVHSFGIEGVTLRAQDIQQSVIASMAGRNLDGATRRSDRVAQMMLEARDPKTKLDEQTLCRWHHLLFAHTEAEDLGRWRQSEMVIVKSARADREEILYNAIPAASVGDAMKNWVAGANSHQGRSVPVFAALMHLWFESIHPFSDGNGRIGRAIVENIFAKTDALPFSMSRQIESDKTGYYAALQAGRVLGEGQIDATAFVVWFLQCLETAAERGLQEALFLTHRNQFFARFVAQMNDRQIQVLQNLFGQGPTRVDLGISNKSYVKIAKTSVATATRDLNELVKIGALNKSGAGGRSTVYQIVYQ